MIFGKKNKETAAADLHEDEEKLSARESRLNKANRADEPDPARRRKRRLAANGTYAAAITSVILIGILIVNLIMQALPKTATVFDLTDTKLFSIGTTTENFLDTLTEPVTISILTETGQEDARITRLASQYAARSSMVTVEEIDVVSNPYFYRDYTDTAPALGSVIVHAGDKSKVIDYYTMYQYASAYSSSPDAFDGEGQLTAAVAYVTNKNTARVYYTTGHNEFELDAKMKDTLEKAGIEAEALNLRTTDIPEDCTALLAFAPRQDFTSDEAAKVSAYLADGGHALLVAAPSLWTGAETPKYDAILASYGVSANSGVVLEGDAYHYDTIPYLLIPDLSSAHAVTERLANQNVVVGLASGIDIKTPEDAAYTVQELLVTTESAYLKTSMNTSYEKEEGDQTGEFVLGASIAQTFSQDSEGSPDVELDSEGDTAEQSAEQTAQKETRILYFTTPTVFSSDALSTLLGQSVELSQGNMELFSSSLTYLTDQETVVSVPAKSMSVQRTTINSGMVTLLGNVFMFLIPAAVLAGGLFIFVRRRRR
ncbi:MAG: Gldg family protein [Lachnospiraceae bacterium]|nr:Gldg family protein [Lachnospiraceae bacterium]